MSDFTNRHGRSFSEVKIAADTLPEPAHKTEPPKPAHRKRRHFRLSTVHVRILAGILVVCIVTPVLVGEYVHYVYEAQVTNAKKDVQLIFSDVKVKQNSDLTSDVLKTFDARLLAVRDKLCPGGFLDNLAKLYPRAQTAYNACGVYKSRVVDLESGVNEAAAQLAYLEQLQPLLGGITKPLDDQFAVLAAQQENWQTFVTSLQQLTAPSSFQSTHAQFVAQAQAIRDQWIALVQASNGYDSAKFSDARTKLTVAYTAFQKQTDAFHGAIQQCQASILQARSLL